MLLKCLRNYHKSLVMDLLKKSNDQVKILTDHQFLLGFSEGQIGQVLKHCESILSVQDVLDKVEKLWDLKHAQFIVQSLSQMFGDLEDFDD